MLGVILGLLVGLFLSLIIWGVGFYIYEFHTYSESSERICILATVLLCIGLIILSVFLMCQFDKNEYSRRIMTFEETKQTIEESLKSEELSGFERVELVNKVIEENKELLKFQFDCQQWYGFNIDDKVLEIELINFK